VSGVDGDGDGSDGGNGAQQVLLRPLLDVDVAGTGGADVLLLEKAFTAMGCVRIGGLKENEIINPWPLILDP
jgi:hypothetical protein